MYKHIYIPLLTRLHEHTDVHRQTDRQTYGLDEIYMNPKTVPIVVENQLLQEDILSAL